MTSYFAVMAGIGQLCVCYLLGYPVEYVARHFLMRFLDKLQQKHIEWAEYNVAWDEENRTR